MGRVYPRGVILAGDCLCLFCGGLAWEDSRIRRSWRLWLGDATHVTGGFLAVGTASRRRMVPVVRRDARRPFRGLKGFVRDIRVGAVAGLLAGDSGGQRGIGGLVHVTGCVDREQALSLTASS